MEIKGNPRIFSPRFRTRRCCGLGHHPHQHTRVCPLWGGNIVGFGRYQHRSEPGHEGENFLAGFAPRKSKFSIYVMGGYRPETESQRENLLATLGNHRIGKACLYVRRLADIALGVLEQLVARSAAALRSCCPTS